MLDASKTQLLRLYTWTKQKAIKQNVVIASIERLFFLIANQRGMISSIAV